MKTTNRKQQGFTLIELLIVIAVLGVLAAVVLVAVDPLEQLARGRDAGRKNTMGQLYNSVLAFYTAREAKLPALAPGGVANTWVTGLKNAGEILVVPSNALAATYVTTGTAPCAGTGANVSVEAGFCYKTTLADNADQITNPGTDAIVYVRLESKVEQKKCPAATPVPFFLWHANESKTGVVCATAAAEPVIQAIYTFI